MKAGATKRNRGFWRWTISKILSASHLQRSKSPNRKHFCCFFTHSSNTLFKWIAEFELFISCAHGLQFAFNELLIYARFRSTLFIVFFWRIFSSTLLLCIRGGIVLWTNMNVLYASIRPNSGTIYFIDTIHLTIYTYTTTFVVIWKPSNRIDEIENDEEVNGRSKIRSVIFSIQI